MNKNIKIVPYDPKWREQFAIEAKQIKQALGANCFEVFHIGSTSVPSLHAKPILDILPVVKDIKEVDKKTAL